MSTKYNGWTNWDTWNTNLWLTNDENIYVKSRGLDINALKEAFLSYFGLDHDRINIERVNWNEIVDGLRSE